jgi:deoxyribodipyrimidine photolyase-related protein
MSNYCAGCRYKTEVKTGEEACPFNYLYWDFYARHEKHFARNPRVGMALKTLATKTPAEQCGAQQVAELLREQATDRHG